MTVATIPDLRQPPHDPLSLLLGGRLGWPLAKPSEPPTESLHLPRDPASLRLLSEPSGSLGGLVAPLGVAVDADGTVWLLDAQSERLLQFDGCRCRFVDSGCFGGRGSGAGRLHHAGGIAIAANHLFVCDTGNQRVQVVVLPNQVVSAIWRAPMAWQPSGVAIDRRFRVHVTDPQNGMVHRFGWSGRYLGNTSGVGDARAIAITRDGAVVVAGSSGAYRVHDDGTITPITGTADDLRDEFAAPPFPVAANGAMQLGALCVPPAGEWFDLHGRQVAAPTPPDAIYQRTATVVLGPLDSQIDECAWHRVVFSGALPSGCGFELSTLTAHLPLSADEVDAFPETAWTSGPTCTVLPAGGWDALVRSGPARYLWLRLRLFGNGTTTPRLDEALVEFPRISLRRYLPAIYGAEPTSADFTDRLLAIFDRSLRDIEQRVDELPALVDPQATPDLDWLGSWLGITPDHRMPEAFRRAELSDAGHLMDLRGTVVGLRRLLVIALGFAARAERDTCDEHPSASGCARCAPCPEPRLGCPPRPVQRRRWHPPPLILEHFRLRRWFEAGASTLGDRTMLWGQSIVNRSQLGSSAQVGASALKGTQDPARDPFHVYAHKFTVFVPASAGRTEQRRRALEQLVAWASPAHTQGHVEYVDARLRIGVQSAIGLDTVVARMPAGVTLGASQLGSASVLDGDDKPAIDGSAVGSTTVLG
jgi:phage tail-like protein